MNTFHIKVEEEKNERLDYFIAKNLEKVSRSYVKKLIKDDLVLVNGIPMKSSYNIKQGDLIEINMPEPESVKATPEDIPVNIIYEDEDILVVNKPQDMVVHPGAGNYSGTLVNGLLYHIESLSTINGDIRPGIVHRLDKDTSGVLIVAKNNKAHEIISLALKNREVKKVYLALVHGNVKGNSGTIDAPIGRHEINRKKMTVRKTNSKEAISHFRVLNRFDKFTLVEVSLETGRTHQIRVHMAYINHSIVGDPVYSRRKNKFGLDKQMLHAHKVGFIHPSKNEYIEFIADLPDYFLNIIDKLKNKRK